MKLIIVHSATILQYDSVFTNTSIELAKHTAILGWDDGRDTAVIEIANL